MINTDAYLGRRFDPRTYNCLHFTRDVWRDLTGVDIVDRLHGLFAPGRRVRREHLRAFSELRGPRDPCLVLMRRPGGDPHIGVHLRGRVLHLQENGAEFFPISVASRGFTSVRFFLPC